MSELLWVAVPNGFTGPPSPTSPPRLRIRVLIVPRLAAGAVSGTELADWPDRVLGLSFLVRNRVGSGGTVTTRRTTPVSSTNADAWTGFFTGDAGIAGDFQPTAYPPPTVTPTAQHATAAHVTARQVTRDLATPTSDPGRPNQVVRTQLASWATPPTPPPVADQTPATFTTPDFHATVAALREHPRVLMDLGLIVELGLDPGALSAVAGDLQLSVACTELPAPFVVSPWTRYQIDTARNVFRPAPAPGSGSGISQGVVDLSNCTDITSLTATPTDGVTQWALTTFDVDGIVGGLHQTANDLRDDPNLEATMPPMRSIGLALLRPGRHTDFAARIATATANAAAAPADTVLSAEDLVLGYRVDVRRDGLPWRSVCARSARYSVSYAAEDGTETTVALAASDGSTDTYTLEEGHVKAFSAVKDGSGGLNADETVLRWGGWSLAVPMPNLATDTAGSARTAGQQLPYQFDWDFRVPGGSLPALRFSSVYQLRLRIADLAGGGVDAVDVHDDRIASEAVVYRRYEPVPPPLLHADPDLAFATGAALDRLVVRSDRGLTPSQLHDQNPAYPLTETRSLNAPTASLQLVEQHGMLDDPHLSTAQSFDLARRAMGIDAAGTGLADPGASGVMASAVPYELNARDQWTPWPDPDIKNVELVAAADTTTVDAEWVDDGDTRTLLVTLGKAQQVDIAVSSTITPGMEDHLAFRRDFTLFDPAQGEGPIDDSDTLLGLNQAITPPRTLTFVHAVRRPLADPQWTLPHDAVIRGAGDHGALVNATFIEVAAPTQPDTTTVPRGLNTASTGRIDVAATWQEFDDTGPDLQPDGRTISVDHLDGFDLALSTPPPVVGSITPFPLRHEFGDTKHRVITYTLNATSRFRGYFDAADPDALFHASLSQSPVVNVPSSARPPAPVVLGVTPAFVWQRNQSTADRIEHTRSAQRLRVELGRPWFSTGEGETLAVVLGTAADLVTRMGRDPLFATTAPPLNPTGSWFPGASTVIVPLPELNGTEVTVVPFPVIAAEDRWFADVVMAAPAGAQSYDALVSLAVARHQLDSLDCMSLSPVVVTDRVPLMPDRHVTVTHSGGQLAVTVDGVSPTPLNSLQVILEACDPGVDPANVDLLVDDASNAVSVPAWRPVPGGAVSRGTDGTIPVLTLPNTSGPLRLRIRETENLPAAATPTDLTSRTVFLDTIDIPTDWSTT